MSGPADCLLPASLAALLVTLFLALTAVQFVISAGTPGFRVLLSASLGSPLCPRT